MTKFEFSENVSSTSATASIVTVSVMNRYYEMIFTFLTVLSFIQLLSKV